jgi:23S rRNA (pseudouridine1915-N3)-methyltransferase
MRLSVAAIGRLKTGPEKLMADDYRKRIEVMGRKAGITALKIGEWAESQAGSAKQRMEEEAQTLWSAVPAAALTMVLDERGKSLSSEDFADRIRKCADNGVHDIVFMIGGPDGHAAQTREKATEIMALGPMVWPHRLVRIMLLEQVYRSVTIMVNHPYHRS